LAGIAVGTRTGIVRQREKQAMQDFGGRVAVVTGAASGIGRALATALSQLEMKLVLADVEASALGQVADTLRQEGRSVLAVPTDVAQADRVAMLAERAYEEFGAVHLLCNNAGVFAAGLSYEAPQSDYDWCFGVNVWGILNGLRSFLPRMLASGEPGHVVNTASMAALTSVPFSAPYAMSKAAVLSLSESLYLEMQARSASIGVSVVCPELFDTQIGWAERNRPAHLERKDEEGASPEREGTEQAIKAATATGQEPGVLAQRIIEGVRENQLYVLAPEGDPWREACNTRLDDLRAGRNPGGAVPGS